MKQKPAKYTAMRYLDPKADLTFKKVFGEHADLVISLLSALLPFPPEEEILDVEYLSPELVPENPLRKNSIVDVRCRDNRGRRSLSSGCCSMPRKPMSARQMRERTMSCCNQCIR